MKLFAKIYNEINDLPTRSDAPEGLGQQGPNNKME